MATKARTPLDAWEKVSESFGSLEADLRQYSATRSAEAAADRAAFEESVKGLISAFEESIGAAARLVRNPALGEDLADMAATIRDAFVATIQAAGQQVRDRLPVTSGATPGRAVAKRAPAPARKAPARKASAGKMTTAKAAPRSASKAAPAKARSRKTSTAS